MSSSSKITRRVYLLRLRKMAEKALSEYGIEEAKLRAYRIGGNDIYRLEISPDSIAPKSIAPGQYNLRLHQSGYMNPEYIPSELEWLSALHDNGIPVPKPCMTLNGEWMTFVESKHERPGSRNCTLIQWIEGRLPKNPNLQHMKAVGHVIGRMHTQSINWKKPRGFARPSWNWDGLYGKGFDYGFDPEVARSTVPGAFQQAFSEAIEQVREGMEQLGTGKKVFGLIHGDLGVDGNILFHGEEARPIDFDDCGFGYWLFDLGVALAHYSADVECPRPKMREALIEGYEETTPLSETNLEYLDLFIMARLAQLIYFWHGMGILYPQYRDQSNEEIQKYGKEMKKVQKRFL